MGTSLSVSGTANYIVAGVVRTDSGVLTLAYFAPSGRIIVSSTELVNAMVLEYQHPDSFIAGGLRLNDNLGTHAYLVRVNALFGSVRYGVRYPPVDSLYPDNTVGNRRLLSKTARFDSVSKGIVRVGNDVYMIVDAVQTFGNVTGRTSLSVIKADIATGEILQQVHVSSRNASISCSAITTSSTQLYFIIACSLQRHTLDDESVVISTDLRLSFSKLPVGFDVQEYVLFTPKRVAFQNFALPVSTKSTQIVATSYRFSTADGVPTPQPTVLSTERPTVLQSSAPSGQPSSSPTAGPSVSPQPTSQPSSSGPTNTYKPTVKPTQRPNRVPSKQPTVSPTVKPTIKPTIKPTEGPSIFPSTQPSPIRTTAPTRNPAGTIQPTLRSTSKPSLKPTPAPSTAPSAALLAATAGYREERANSPVMILVYIVSGLTALWCIYKLLICYLHARQKQKRNRKMQEELDTIPVSTSDQPVHQPHLPTERALRAASNTHTPRGAYATGTPISTNKSNPGRDALRGGVGSSSSDSSVVLSSLHSSEMSDISYSVYSDEQGVEESSSVSHLPRSKESIMEEGGDQDSSMSDNVNSNGNSKESNIDADFASSAASDFASSAASESNGTQGSASCNSGIVSDASSYY